MHKVWDARSQSQQEFCSLAEEDVACYIVMDDLGLLMGKELFVSKRDGFFVRVVHRILSTFLLLRMSESRSKKMYQTGQQLL
jgi:hypothetical protein